MFNQDSRRQDDMITTKLLAVNSAKVGKMLAEVTQNQYQDVCAVCPEINFVLHSIRVKIVE